MELSTPDPPPLEEVVIAADCESTYVLMAFAEARVSSLPLTELIFVSKTPLFKLSTSIFDMVLLSTSMVLLVNV